MGIQKCNGVIWPCSPKPPRSPMIAECVYPFKPPPPPSHVSQKHQHGSVINVELQPNLFQATPFKCDVASGQLGSALNCVCFS